MPQDRTDRVALLTEAGKQAYADLMANPIFRRFLGRVDEWKSNIREDLIVGKSDGTYMVDPHELGFSRGALRVLSEIGPILDRSMFEEFAKPEDSEKQ